ncbi:MAG: IS1634 family transposase [Cyanobacteria bacterium CRU_2_1]|nr:IS1634 family transposase [Cyanobacteria bacterium CRU_2_1]
MWSIPPSEREDNLQQLSGLRWLTRVPLTLNAASELVNHLPNSALVVTELEGYRIATVCVDYGGVQQRWFVVESQERQKADLKQLEKTLTKATTYWQSQLRQLCAQEFACQSDALAALKQFEQNLAWHQLENTTVKQKLHYEKPGKPKRDTPPSRITYHPQASLTLNPTVVAMHQQRAGRFILATNVLESEDLSAPQALEEYKGQQGNERGFRFLKDPPVLCLQCLPQIPRTGHGTWPGHGLVFTGVQLRATSTPPGTPAGRPNLAQSTWQSYSTPDLTLGVSVFYGGSLCDS